MDLSLDLNKISQLVEEGTSNLIPVYQEISADLLTPVAAYLRLSKDEKQSFLLESVTGGENISRYSYIAAGDFRTFKANDKDGDPLITLEKELNLVKYAKLPGINYFTGGAVGYISYDCVRFFEPHTARVEIQDTLKLPNAVLMFVDNLVVFDHLRHCIIIVSHFRVTENIKNKKDIEIEYERVKSTINSIRKTLEMDHTPLPDQKPIELGPEAVSNVGKDGYEGFVKNLKKYIKAGDVIQTVPSQRFTKKTNLHPFNAYRQLRSVNPSPYMFYIDLHDFQIVGASPEMLVKVDEGKVYTNPIAGTIRRGKTPEEDDALAEQLLGDLKERSEHLMLVDLGRNDVNRVCDPNTVKVDSLMHIERYSHVMHIVSNVSGYLRKDKTRFDAFRSVFPAGTVSGAPKVRAMELIYNLEKDKRGIYAGAVGTFSYGNSINTGIAIRTMLFKNGNVYLQSGGGIVFDSDPEFEYYETVNKLLANVKAIEAAEKYYHSIQNLSNTSMDIEGEKVTKKRKVHKDDDNINFNKLKNIKVTNETKHDNIEKKNITVMIDNYDSFTFNVYQCLSQLGANLVVFRNDEVLVKDIIKLNPRNIVISPGPGHPRDAAISNDIIKYFAGKIPILGICLGEQCMYEIYGGTVTFAGEIIHGKTTPIQHDGKGLFKGLPQEIHCTRYHSLAGSKSTLPESLEITSTTRSGIVMGVRHKTFVMEGVQFHPESVGSEFGLEILSNFLKWEGGTWDKLKINENNVKQVSIDESMEKKKVGQGLNLTDIIKLNAVDHGVENNSTEIKKESILEKIKKQRLEDIAESKLLPGKSYHQLLQTFKEGGYSQKVSLSDKLKTSDGPIAVIAEIKRASPSKADINININAVHQGVLYAKSGASAISVLTEPKWFKGSLEDLRDIRLAIEDIPNRPALLRKDFVIDKYQILEAAISGADAILLIVAILDDVELLELYSFANNLGLESLVEVATEDEMIRALKVLPTVKMIGVNNRNLHTFTVDMNRTSRLSELLGVRKNEVILVALSGITSSEDTKKYLSSGARAALVGESLMKSNDPAELINELSLMKKSKKIKENKLPLKICGLTNEKDALYAAEHGAQFLGFIFSKSPRQITADKAYPIIEQVKSKYYTSTNQQINESGLDVEQDIKQWFKASFPKNDKSIKTIGLFYDESIDFVNRTCHKLSLDYVQLHGKESPEYINFINTPVIKCIHVEIDDTVGSVFKKIEPYVGKACAILLDTGKGTSNIPGGNGIKFDWKIASDLVEKYEVPIFLAGGINTDNIKEANEFIKKAHSSIILDICSGVEQEKGIKDHSKILNITKQLK